MLEQGRCGGSDGAARPVPITLRIPEQARGVRRARGEKRGLTLALRGVAARAGDASGGMRVTLLEPIQEFLLPGCHACLSQSDTVGTGIEQYRNVRPSCQRNSGWPCRTLPRG